LFFLLVSNKAFASHDTSFLKYKSYKNNLVFNRPLVSYDTHFQNKNHRNVFLCLINRSCQTILLFEIKKIIKIYFCQSATCVTWHSFYQKCHMMATSLGTSKSEDYLIEYAKVICIVQIFICLFVLFVCLSFSVSVWNNCGYWTLG